MGKAALTFAEIFIVLGLIFLIQMVANFNIYEGTSEVPPPDFTILKIRQIPSDGNDADHIKYLRFSSHDETLDLNLQISLSPLMLRDTGSYIDNFGMCRNRNNSKFLYQTYSWKEINSREKFIDTLYSKYKISLSMVKVSDAQNEYILSWSPDEIPKGATLTVAIEHCFLPKTEKSTKLDSAWNVEGNTVPYPHPLIFEKTEFRESIDVQPSRRVMAHYTQFYDDNNSHNRKLPNTTGPEFSGFAFHTSVHNCDVSNLNVGYVRQNIVKEVNITL